jgi:hypothetical protein
MGLVDNTPGLVPHQKKVTLSDNYLSFTDGTNTFAQQYLPELHFCSTIPSGIV